MHKQPRKGQNHTSDLTVVGPECHGQGSSRSRGNLREEAGGGLKERGGSSGGQEVEPSQDGPEARRTEKGESKNDRKGFDLSNQKNGILIYKIENPT